ncbi:MAG: carboxypeptidase-like regulatory domain-containing protein, partial [Bacteroidales bacterium]|nr:carboxypeptidase-like regulatory domain-containing protein [Bacteroidales bacterium]
MRRNLVVFLFIIFSTTLLAQKFTISGYVHDAASSEKLYGANIYDVRTNLGVASNEYGFFSLTLPQDSVHLVVSYVGYTSYRYDFYLDKNINLNIDLEA